jgi:hypothetical protein
MFSNGIGKEHLMRAPQVNLAIGKRAVRRLFVVGIAIWLAGGALFCAGILAEPPPKLTVQDTPLNRELRAPISFAPVAKRLRRAS